MSQINVMNLSFGYDGSYDMIFEQVSFRIDTDWKLGFTGRNGCGKTTFLRLLMGELSYRGTISTPVEFDYFPFKIPDGTLYAEEIAREVCPESEPWQIMRELKLLNVAEDAIYRPFETLSNGEQTKVLLALLFLKQNNFLLIDEPTNHLDAMARETVGKYLNRKKGFILVSHDRKLLDGCVDHILSVNKTNIEIQSGNFSTWMENKRRQDAYELDRNERLKTEIKRMKETARQKANWSDRVEKTRKGVRVAGLRPDRGAIGHKAAKMMKRAKSVELRAEHAAEEKAKLLKNIEKEEKLIVRPLTYHSAQLAWLKDVSVCYGERTICSDINLAIGRGDIIALCGKNGCGKSSLLKLLCGEKVPHDGSVFVGSGVKISWVPQDTSFLQGSIEQFLQENEIDGTIFRTLLRKMNFSRAQMEKDMRDFSAGQKKKALLAKSLCEPAHLYVWDEPLNYIDVISRIQIEQLIRECSPTILLVEHDEAFLENIGAKQVRIG